MGWVSALSALRGMQRVCDFGHGCARHRLLLRWKFTAAYIRMHCVA